MNDGFNPKNLDQPVDAFQGGVFQAFRQHLNRLVERVNYISTLLKPDRLGGARAGGKVVAVGCNANGEPVVLQVLTVGTPTRIGDGVSLTTSGTF